jgi:hypothetical protein
VKRIFFILTTICLLNICNSVFAQSDNSTGNWNALFWKAKLNKKWSLVGEGQIKSNTYSLKYDYYEIKAGISYALAKNLTGTFSSGLYRTFQTGGIFLSPIKQKEFRTWLELFHKLSFDHLNIDQRVRLEQRFIGDSYKNRFRYRLAFLTPFNTVRIVPGSIYLNLVDELFMPQNGLTVEKNRFYAGLGYKLNENVALQVGNMRDTDYKPDSRTRKNYVQVLFICDFTNLFKKHL